jgi:hypothetical protein
MNPLITLALFWAAIMLAALVFGIFCIKYGQYTSGSRPPHPTLEV